MPRATTLAVAMAIAAVFMAARVVTHEPEEDEQLDAASCLVACERFEDCRDRRCVPGADGWALPARVEPECECLPRVAAHEAP